MSTIDPIIPMLIVPTVLCLVGLVVSKLVYGKWCRNEK